MNFDSSVVSFTLHGKVPIHNADTVCKGNKGL